MTKGGRNLMLMGAAAILISLATTGVALSIYRESGDIYLDRSRPGYLPDEEEVDEGDPEGEFVFQRTGVIDAEALDEYLEALEVEIRAVDEVKKPFSAGALSDEGLGLEK